MSSRFVNSLKNTVVSAIFLIIANISLAEEIRLVGSQGSSSVSTPTIGQTNTTVAANFGQPLQASGSVGEPPISRWEYSQFFVYFEYDRVIHSVVKR